MIGLIIVACFVNLFIGSASAKWAILAPVFVPMMMLMGYDPAITQAVYRIGDSITNPLSPLFTYMPVILGYARKVRSQGRSGQRNRQHDSVFRDLRHRLDHPGDRVGKLKPASGSWRRNLSVGQGF